MRRIREMDSTLSTEKNGVFFRETLAIPRKGGRPVLMYLAEQGVKATAYALCFRNSVALRTTCGDLYWLCALFRPSLCQV